MLVGLVIFGNKENTLLLTDLPIYFDSNKGNIRLPILNFEIGNRIGHIMYGIQ